MNKALSGKSYSVSPSKEWSGNSWYKHPEKKMIFQENAGWHWFQHGVAKGIAWGGNMGSILSLAGTPYWPNCDDAILFLEDDEVETIQTIDRYLTQMQQMGLFYKCKGVILSKFPTDVNATKEDIANILKRVMPPNIPVLMDFDFGHIDPILTIPLGRNCSIDELGVSLN